MRDQNMNEMGVLTLKSSYPWAAEKVLVDCRGKVMDQRRQSRPELLLTFHSCLNP